MTLLSILYLALGVIIIVVQSMLVVVGFLFFALLNPANRLTVLNVSQPQVFAWGLLLGAYFFLQGYGFWHLKPWSWWLYLASIIVHLASYLIIPTLFDVLYVPLIAWWLLVLLYLIKKRDLFEVRMPRSPL